MKKKAVETFISRRIGTNIRTREGIIRMTISSSPSSLSSWIITYTTNICSSDTKFTLLSTAAFLFRIATSSILSSLSTFLCFLLGSTMILSHRCLLHFEFDLFILVDFIRHQLTNRSFPLTDRFFSSSNAVFIPKLVVSIPFC